MLKSLIIGIGLTPALVLLWTLVQTFWKKTFREEYFDEDVLAGRRSCSNCGCTTICERKEEAQNGLQELTKQKAIKHRL